MILQLRRGRRRAHLSCLLTTVLVPVAALATPAAAQDAAQAAHPAAATPPHDQNDVADIIVTATRKSQALSHVAASIVAKDQVELDKQGVRSIADIARITPGITLGQTATAYGTGQTTISIRAVDSSSGIPTTGVYIDDTPVQTRTGVSPSLGNAYPQVFDLDRVEVLRGPQGTLFGSGSVGGAIRFISPQPNYNDIGIYGRAEVAATQNGAPSYEAGLAGGAPIVEDKLGFRASVWYRRDGGFIDRLDRYTKDVTQRDINSQTTFAARLALGWKATDTLTITPSIFYQDQNIADGSRYELATSDSSNAQYNLSLNALPEYHKDRFYLPALKVALDFGGATLTSDSSYFSRDTQTRSDDASLSMAIFAGVSGSFLPGFETYTPNTISNTRQRAFTQEVRLANNNPNDRFNWIVGLFYQHAKVSDQYGGTDPRLLDVINAGQDLKGEPEYGSLTDIYGTELYRGLYSTYQDNHHIDDQKAAYAQGDFEIVPRVKLTAGARYTIADYKYSGFTAGPLYTTDGRLDQLEATSRTVTPKFGVSFQADTRNLFYVTAAKGIRGPGVSPAAGATCQADGAAIGFDPLKSNTINPDSIWSYEAGSKNRLFGGKLAIDASIYHVDWKNVQTLLILPGCQQQVMLNLGDAKIDGADLALTARPLKTLTLGASISYTNARYTTNIPGPDGITVRRAGEPLPVAPWSIQLNAEVTHQVQSVETYGRLDFTYNSHNARRLDLSSPLVDPALPRPPATSLLNLRVGGRFDISHGNAVDLSLFINNVTNSHPVLSLFHETLDSTWYRAGTFRPRTIGLTMTLRH